MMQLPAAFLESIAPYPALAQLPDALDTEASVSVRYNLAKTRVPDGADPVPWCADGAYLADRPRFTFDPALHQGVYYVQDASSMAVSAVAKWLADGMDVCYLDMCAAPGGKTIGALSALSPGSLVVANEYDYRRAEILVENVAKWGRPNVVVSRGETARFRRLAETFDIVAVDAPCSGEGMMRKDPQAVDQWSPALVGQCAALQREILANAWTALRPGGYLIYSTCTFNTAENEDNVAWLADEYGAIPVTVPALEGAPGIAAQVKGDIPCYRFIPGRVRGEGLFLCVLRKPGESHRANRSESARRKNRKEGANPAVPVGKWLAPQLHPLVRDTEIYAVPEKHAALVSLFCDTLGVLTAGVHVATVKGRDLVPAHPLALSGALQAGAFPTVEVDEATALDYLHRDAISLPEGTPRGFVLLKYKGNGLGFVKNLGARSNNLYPKNWRILSRTTV